MLLTGRPFQAAIDQVTSLDLDLFDVGVFQTQILYLQVCKMNLLHDHLLRAHNASSHPRTLASAKQVSERQRPK